MRHVAVIGSGPAGYYKAEAAAGAIIRMLSRWLEEGAVLAAEDMIAQAKSILSFFAHS